MLLPPSGALRLPLHLHQDREHIRRDGEVVSTEGQLLRDLRQRQTVISATLPGAASPRGSGGDGSTTRYITWRPVEAPQLSPALQRCHHTALPQSAESAGRLHELHTSISADAEPGLSDIRYRAEPDARVQSRQALQRRLRRGHQDQ